MSASITSRKFYSQYRNGETWAALPLDLTYWLIGMVGEKLKVETSFEIVWGSGGSVASATDGFAKSGATFSRSLGSFIDDGFTIGDEVLAYNGSSGSPTAPNLVNNAIILALTDTTMLLDTTISGSDGALSWVRIYGITDLEGCIFKYGLIENGEATNYNSKIDGNLQEYSANGIVTAGAGVPVTMQALNSQNVKSWQNGTVSITYDSETNGGTRKNYTISQEFILLPYYIDGFLNDIQGGTLPNLFQNGNTLKHVFTANMRDTVNNPNTNKNVSIDDILGNVGFFEQNFNGFNNVFSVSNNVITEVSSGNPSSGIIVDSKTRYNFDVSRSAGTFNAGVSSVIVGVSYLPAAADYAGNLNTVEENFLFDSKLQIEGAGVVSSTIVKDVTVTISGNILQVQADIEYSAAQQALLDDSKNYVVWVLVGSDVGDFTANESNAQDDRVSIVVDSNLYVKDSDVTGIFLIRDTESQFFRQYRNALTEAGKTDVKGWITDNYSWKVALRMSYFEGREIKAASFKLAAYNATTGDFFILQEQAFDLTSSVIVPSSQIFSSAAGVQTMVINQNRGFDLELDDQFNAFRFQNQFDPVSGQPIVQDNLAIYNILIGFKLNYEEWLGLPNANTVFVDVAEPNNGLNKKASRYSLLNGYAIVTALDLTAEHVVDGVTGETDYRFIAPDFQVQDFHIDGNPKALWTCLIETFSEDETVDFGGLIKSDENTLIKATFTPTTYQASLDYIGRISLDNGNGTGSINSIRDLSSLTGVLAGFNDASPVSELKPVVGETGVKITDTGAVVELRALVDYTKVNAGACFNIYARLWSEGLPEIEEVLASDTGDVSGSSKPTIFTPEIQS